MRHVPIAEFKDHLSEMIAAVEAGDEIVITRHGRATARVVPMEESLDERRRRSAEALQKMRLVRDRMRAAGLTATAEEWIAWRDEGRR